MARIRINTRREHVQFTRLCANGRAHQRDMPDADCALLGVEGDADVAVAVIVYRDEAQQGKIAANARSPVILNLKNRKGMQKVLSEVHPTLLYRAR